MTRSRTRALTLAAALTVLLPLTSAQAGDTARYGAPFAVGPAGGDSFSQRSADPGGRVTIGRVYPVPALIGCGSGAPFAALRVVHVAEEPVSEVAVDYVEAAVEPYTFLSVGVHGDGEWLASRKQRGVIAGSGTVTVPIAWPEEDVALPREVVVDIGLESSGACPSVNGGTVRFTEVRVS